MSDERDRHYEELLHEVARLRQIAANAQDSEAIERWERERAAWSAEYADSQLVHQARIEVAKETVARAYSAADFVRNAAASIVTLYTGVLGITSVLGKEQEGPFPARGILPAIFLSGAIIGSAAYVALIQKPRPLEPPKPHSSLPELQERRLSSFVDWVTATTLRRAYALHFAVISLAMGTLFLPAPYLEVLDGSQWVSAAVIAAAITLALPYFTTRVVLAIEAPRLTASVVLALTTFGLSYLIVRSGLAVGELAGHSVWIVGSIFLAALFAWGLRLRGLARATALVTCFLVSFLALRITYDLTSDVTLAGDCREADVSEAAYKGKTGPRGAPVYELPDRGSQVRTALPAAGSTGVRKELGELF
jgi:hypothetical protein